MRKIARTLAAIGLATVPALALAAPGGAAGEAAPAAAPTAASGCPEPVLAEKFRVSADELGRTGEQVKAFVDCMGPVIEARRKAAEKLYDDAKTAAELSNATISKVNAIIDGWRKYEAEHSDDEKS